MDCRRQFHQRQTRSRDHPTSFLRRDVVPRLTIWFVGTMKIRRKRLVVMVKKFRQLFCRHFLN